MCWSDELTLCMHGGDSCEGVNQFAQACVYSTIRGCLELLRKFCFINSTVEQLYKKLELVQHLFKCCYNFIFSQTEYVKDKII